jgi:hypothetical protein
VSGVGVAAPEAAAPLSFAELLGLDVVRVTRADVLDAGRAFARPPWSDLSAESPDWRLRIGPGVLIGARKSARQMVREFEMAELGRHATAKAWALFLADDPEWRSSAPPFREVTGWSLKSRANMVKTLALLDWSPLTDSGRATAMVTLTYPADWTTVAPSGKTVKRHVKAFVRRFSRAWGEPIVAAWKLEFQLRGAPHIHILMAPPHGVAGQAHARPAAGDGLPFNRWLSVVWADIVNHPDAVEYMKHLGAGTNVDYAEGLRYRDPKRLSVYFGKHGAARSKEYQNIVPAPWRAPGRGPGRFWGYWGLKRAAADVELGRDDYYLAMRILRRYSSHVQVWDRERGRMVWTRAMQPAKQRWKDVDRETGEVIWRKRRRRRRARRFDHDVGFVLVNNGASVARQLARALEVCGVRK